MLFGFLERLDFVVGEVTDSFCVGDSHQNSRHWGCPIPSPDDIQRAKKVLRLTTITWTENERNLLVHLFRQGKFIPVLFLNLLLPYDFIPLPHMYSHMVTDSVNCILWKFDVANEWENWLILSQLLPCAQRSAHSPGRKILCARSAQIQPAIQEKNTHFYWISKKYCTKLKRLERSAPWNDRY